MERLCWNCHFFEHDPELNPYSGKCRRNAPKGLDANTLYVTGQQQAHLFKLGLIDSTIFKSADSPLNLFANAESPFTLPMSDGNGFNANGCFPLFTTPAHKVTTVSFQCSLVNTGAATVGDNPILEIGVYAVTANADVLAFLVEIPIPPASVGVAGNTTDNLVLVHHNIPVPLPEGGGVGGTFAAKIHLYSGDENKIGEIRNPFLATEIEEVSETYAGPAFPWISRGNIDWCGEFKQSVETVPPLP